MKRASLILLALAAVIALGVFASIVSHGFRELRDTEHERERLKNRAVELEKRVQELDQTLEAIHTDPAAVESLARRELGWVRPGETVILLATPTPPPEPPSLTGPEPTPILTLPD
jgi:cell division protein FtsB